MFSAVQKDGEIFNLFPRYSRKILLEKRKNEEFYCPECKEKVIMKLGEKRIEHFAHQKKSRCSESYERESEYHMNGKLQLYQWLKKQNVSPVLEPYYPSIRQRPDVGFMYQSTLHALEFQCSVIPFELMAKRTKYYKRINAAVLWILGGKNIKRKGARKVSLTHFDYYFVSQSPSGSWFLPAYCPSSQNFIILHNLFPISTKNVFAHLSIIPLHEFTLERLSVKAQHHPFSASEWRNEMQMQKQNILMWGRRQYHELLTELYLSRVNLTLLPPFIGLPISNSLFIESPLLIWQIYFFIDQLWKRKAGELIKVNDVFQGYVKRLNQGLIKERTLPLVHASSPLAPIMEYLQVLEKVHVLERLSTNIFRIQQTIELANYMAEQQEIEERFFMQYAALLFH